MYRIIRTNGPIKYYSLLASQATRNQSITNSSRNHSFRLDCKSRNLTTSNTTSSTNTIPPSAHPILPHASTGSGLGSNSTTTTPKPATSKVTMKEETGFEKALRLEKELAQLTAALGPSPTLISDTKTDSSTSQTATEKETVSSVTPTILAAPPQTVAKKTIMMKIKHELNHYWIGLKLLATETKISSRLLIKVLKGITLSRREVRQLRRTTQDLLRLVPFIIILLIPFLEFALPVLLKLFPGMLPSTFESKPQAEERKMNLLKVRIQMAKFLQETIGEVALSGTSRGGAKQFNDFFQSLRSSGELAPVEEIVRIAKGLEDELTLTSLSRPQLVSLARFMALNAFGTDSFLRSTIEHHLKGIKKVLIMNDGVDSRDRMPL